MKKETAPVRIAILGAGFAGNFHANAYAKVSGVDLKIKAIYDTDQEKAKAFAQKWDVPVVAGSLDEILNDPEINLVDIVTPPFMHLEPCIQAIKAGKYVACEKPLTGYFGQEGDEAPIGRTVPKRKMYDYLMGKIAELEEVLKGREDHFLYAENYIYSPTMLRAAEMVRAKKSKILYMKGEESIRNTTSPLSGEWRLAGGGSLMRLASHPIGGVLWMKQQEAEARGETITIKSIVADVGYLYPSLSDHDRRYFPANPQDVEDFSSLVITFSDGSKAHCMGNDNTLGGVKNFVEVYTSDSSLVCNMTPTDNLQTYFLDQEGLDDVYISEQLRDKLGWNKVFISEETLRGYLGEFQDFAEVVAEGKKPLSGIRVAIDTMKVMYGAYISAEEGVRFEFE